jgi:hypothetical protein
LEFWISITAEDVKEVVLSNKSVFLNQDSAVGFVVYVYQRVRGK